MPSLGRKKQNQNGQNEKNPVGTTMCPDIGLMVGKDEEDEEDKSPRGIVICYIFISSEIH